jgi:Gram-negative bacterial TonB protein C-terminal
MFKFTIQLHSNQVMKQTITLLSLFVLSSLSAQSDTTIYVFAEEMPRFINCEDFATNKEKDSCSSIGLQKFVYSNVRYPEAARVGGTEGTVVLSYVVESEGNISNLKISKDIGNGCGLEVQRIFQYLIDNNIKFVPAKMKGKNVRVRMNLPVKFKLEEIKPYNLVGLDSIYFEPDSIIKFNDKNGIVKFVQQNLKFPNLANKDTCIAGDIDMVITVRQDGSILISDIIDFADLGLDFQFEAIACTHLTDLMWKPAVYKGKIVTSNTSIRIPFRSTNPKCKVSMQNFEEGLSLKEQALGDNDSTSVKAIKLLDKAIAISPKNYELNYTRGMILLNQKQFDLACEDLTLVKRRMKVNWFDTILDLICKGK